MPFFRLVDGGGAEVRPAAFFADAPADLPHKDLYWLEVPVSQPVPPPVRLAPRDFLARFTVWEKAAIFSADDPATKVWCAELLAAQFIEPHDPVTVTGITFMRDAGYLTADRAAEILGGN